MAGRRTKTETETERFQEAQVRGFLESLADADRGQHRVTGNHKVALTLVREKLFLQEFKRICTEAFDDLVRPSMYRFKKDRVRTERIDNILLTDLHFGSDLDPREVPVQFGPVEEARRLAHVAKEVADYKPQYRGESSLYVHLAGDIIQNQLHDPRDGAPLAEQVTRAMRGLQQAIFFLACPPDKDRVWRHIKVFGTPGNHGRNTARHHERATHQKWDSIETMIYEAVALACKPLKNVEFVIPYSPYYTYKAFDQWGFITHGDTVLDFGRPQKTIDVGKLVSQTNELNANQPSDQRFSLFAGGHVHSPSGLLHLPNGSDVIINGPLVPCDPYAVSLGNLGCKSCGQTIWESVRGHISGDYRFIRVSEVQDADTSLDAIIKPYQGL